MAFTDDLPSQIEKAYARHKERQQALADQARKDERLFWSRYDAPRPDCLHRHAERFGPEGVTETASHYGIDLTIRRRAPAAPRQRRTSADLRAQAQELHARGMLSAAIADQLNVSDRRAKALLAG